MCIRDSYELKPLYHPFRLFQHQAVVAVEVGLAFDSVDAVSYTHLGFCAGAGLGGLASVIAFTGHF